MRTPFFAAAAVVTALVTACSTQAPPAPAPAASVPAHDEGREEEHESASADRDHKDADGVVRRGQPLTAALEATPVSAVVKNAKDFDGKKVKFTGKVASVCQKMGCWFVVQGDKPEDHIRISTKAHDIYVPRSAVGMSAVVEGTLSVKVLDAKTAEHFASETEVGAKPAVGDVEIAVDVTGLEMRQG